ncbi:MAG: N-acetylmuramoyl-L-alanine amidase [Bradymonadaceae bacterium]|nr:N-acetylmuramoyl-L-alanine amidase [Lujinxingiaceae bacterium]
MYQHASLLIIGCLALILTAGCGDANLAAPQPVEPLGAHGDHSHNDTLSLADAEAISDAFASGKATFARETAFQQVGLIIDGALAPEPLYRVQWLDNSWSEWAELEVTWSEVNYHVARILLNASAKTLEFQQAGDLTAFHMEFSETVVANRETLTREMPLESEVSDTVYLEDEEDDDLRSAQQGLAPSSLVISRTSWGARSPGKVCGEVHRPYRMAIHHTWQPRDDGGNAAIRMRQMQAYHIDSQGWCDIGYHFVVAKSGKIYQGRSNELRLGSHTGGQNTGNIGINLIGDFTTQTPSDTQLNGAARIVRWVHQKYNIPLTTSAVKGHGQWPGQSTSCPGGNLLRRIPTILERAKKGAAPTPRWSAAMSVRLVGTRGDIQPQGSSKSVPDQFAGDAIRAVVVFHNKSSEKLTNVRLGYELPQPHMVPEKYVIYTDHGKFDGKSWKRAGANSDKRNPASDKLRKSGTLYLGNFAPKERKQVVVTLRAKRYSVGEVGHARASFWLRGIDKGVYGPAATYATKPGTNKFGKAMRGRSYVDVLSRNEWQFNTASKYNLEGWTACRKGHHDQLYKPSNAGVMRMRVTGNNSCVQAPRWVHVNANAYDQIVIRTRSFDGAHQMGILFGATGTTPWSGKRMVRFDGRGNGNYHTMVIQMSDHPEWKGTIRRLRIDPLEGRKPKAGARALYDIDRVFFQSSKTRRTSSARQVFVDRPAISPICTALDEDESDFDSQIIGLATFPDEEEEFTVFDGDVEDGAEPIIAPDAFDDFEG